LAVPGTRASLKPLKAFRQGLEDEPGPQVFEVLGNRCTQCGHVELSSRRVVDHGV